MPGQMAIEIKQLKDVQAAMEQAVRDLHGEPMLQAMRRATLLVERQAKMNAPVNTGRLRASITPEVRTAAGNTVEGVVGSNVVYAPFMEYGTRPHYPPLAPLIRWVQLQLKVKGSAAIAVAKGVQRKIGRRGLRARRYLRDAVEINRAEIIKLLTDAVSGITGGTP